MGDPIQQFLSWYHSKYIITKTYFTCCLLTFVFMYFNIVSINQIYLDWPSLQNFQLWRLFTCLLYEDGQSMVIFCIRFHVAYTLIVNVEEKTFDKQRDYPDFIYVVALLYGYTITLTLVFEFYVPINCFFMALICVWLAKVPNRTAKMFGMNVPIKYLPYAYVIYAWLISSPHFVIQLIAGGVFGYAYYYLKIYYKTKTGKDYLKTPKFVELLTNYYLTIENRLRIVVAYPLDEDVDEDPYNM